MIFEYFRIEKCFRDLQRLLNHRRGMLGVLARSFSNDMK